MVMVPRLTPPRAQQWGFRRAYYYVGFETNSRVARYRGIDAVAEPVNLPPGDHRRRGDGLQSLGGLQLGR